MRKNIILLIVTISIVLAIAELLLRWFAPIEPVDVASMYQYDAQTAFALRPNLRIYETTDFQKEIISDSLGTADFKENLDRKRPMVFAVGDSYTEGCGIPADMAYPFQLDMILNRDSVGYYSPRYTVVNLGVFGYGGEQSLLRLEEYAQKLGKPADVLYLGYDNDYADDEAFLSGIRHHNIIAGSPYWPAWLVGPLQSVRQNSQVVKRIWLAYHKLRGDFHEDLVDRTKADTTHPVAEQEKGVLNRLAAACEEMHARLIVAWMGPSPSYGWMERWAAKKNIAFVDWLPKMYSMQAAKPDLPMGNHHSGGHVRGWVNRVLAEEFARTILKKEPQINTDGNR